MYGVQWYFLEFNHLPLYREEGDSLEPQALQNGNSIIGINVSMLFPWSMIITYVLFCFWFIILLARHLTQVKLLTFPYAAKFSLDLHSFQINLSLGDSMCRGEGHRPYDDELWECSHGDPGTLVHGWLA